MRGKLESFIIAFAAAIVIITIIIVVIITCNLKKNTHTQGRDNASPKEINC